MTEDDRSTYVLKVCLDLVQEQQKDLNKTAGLKLLGQLCTLFSKEFVHGFVVTQMIALSHDSSDNVRVVSVEQISKISQYVDQKVFMSKFVPEFSRMSKDVYWQVRFNFVEKSVLFTEFCPLADRNKIFGDIFYNLLNDKTRWVKEAALEKLGHYLALLDSNNQNDKLFNEFLKIPKILTKLNKDVQLKICISVAETLSKIILSHGESTWKSLSVLYKLLLKQNDDVKQILATKIHLLAQCLKKTEHKNELLKVMKENFLSSTSEKLRHAALKNLANFLQVLTPEKREELADIYSQLQQGNRKWRIREIIASQIRILSGLFSEETIIKIIIPISFQLCKDEVAIVRETACKQIPFLLKNVQSNPL